MARLVDGTAGHPACLERFRHGAVAVLGLVAEEATAFVSLSPFTGPATAEIFAVGSMGWCPLRWRRHCGSCGRDSGEGAGEGAHCSDPFRSCMAGVMRFIEEELDER